LDFNRKERGAALTQGLHLDDQLLQDGASSARKHREAARHARLRRRCENGCALSAVATLPAIAIAMDSSVASAETLKAIPG
jgi:hypothetical protein